ncbi:BQ5605_C011g06295 [Microbotryum silenes-dioicae]|uniref:BQ5605_C011g06295 protein n=1 Tax=Microbotryum silenes-dioicae TaxID=796604 RepID=A0A2X0M9B8_9BASI|nr:BQ5605_C011g06295 [Microbotryum silenes-dioicae]
MTLPSDTLGLTWTLYGQAHGPYTLHHLFQTLSHPYTLSSLSLPPFPVLVFPPV